MKVRLDVPGVFSPILTGHASCSYKRIEPVVSVTDKAPFTGQADFLTPHGSKSHTGKKFRLLNKCVLLPVFLQSIGEQICLPENSRPQS